MSGPLVGLTAGRVAQIVLDNPPLNLVTVELTVELRRVLGELAGLAADGQVRAVVLAGAGQRAFCAGSHVGEFDELAGRVAEGKLLLEKLVYRQLADLPVPTIAAIDKDALGGGLELALCCDLRVAARGARLGTPEVRLGVMPGSGGTQRLPRIVGPARAKELMMLGELIDADEAWRIGLVNRVVEAGQAVTEAVGMAETIAQRGPLAVQAVKRLVDLAGDVDLDAGLAAELDASQQLFTSADMREGAAAFFDKRQPDFTGK